MKVSIRTAYRIVKKTEDPESDPIYIPQYQEEGSEEWRTFYNYISGGGRNMVYFYTLGKATDYLNHQKATEDTVVLQTPKRPNYTEETKLIAKDRREKYLRRGSLQRRG
jgi:hypothetical protein